jgi:hypothetical protein
MCPHSAVILFLYFISKTTPFYEIMYTMHPTLLDIGQPLFWAKLHQWKCQIELHPKLKSSEMKYCVDMHHFTANFCLQFRPTLKERQHVTLQHRYILPDWMVTCLKTNTLEFTSMRSQTSTTLFKNDIMCRKKHKRQHISNPPPAPA